MAPRLRCSPVLFGSGCLTPGGRLARLEWESPPSRHRQTADPAGFPSSLFLVEFALFPAHRSRAAQMCYSTVGAVAELSGLVCVYLSR